MSISGFKDLGVGVGLRPAHYDEFLRSIPACVSWVEVISENFMGWKSGGADRALHILEHVRKELPVVLHGVSMSLGSCDPINENYLGKLKILVSRIEPAWISDHLCWTGVNGTNLHDLLPLPYTEEVLSLVSENILHAQDFLGRKILIENPSTYLEFAHSDMTEWEFMSELSQKADCGILLDVNNIYVGSINHGFDPIKYLDAIPVDRVGQIHLAGHTNKETHLVDTHDAPVCEEVWKLYAYATKRFGGVSAMIERDDNIPEWAELAAEIKRVIKIRSERRGV